MQSARLRYDATTRVLSYDATGDGDITFDTSTARELSKLGRSGTWEGNPVEAVQVGFASDATAQRNADALGFLQIASVGPSGPAASASFSSRADIGMKG